MRHVRKFPVTCGKVVVFAGTQNLNSKSKFKIFKSLSKVLEHFCDTHVAKTRFIYGISVLDVWAITGGLLCNYHIQITPK